MCDLGYLYVELTDPPDLESARRWYQRAADAGDADAAENLRLLDDFGS